MATTATAPVSKKTAKQKLSEAKARMKAKIDAAKETYRQTKQNIKTAQQIGYNSGVADYKRLPKTPGVRTAAKNGYGKAMNDSRKHEKLTNKMQGGNKNGNVKKSTSKKNSVKKGTSKKGTGKKNGK